MGFWEYLLIGAGSLVFASVFWVWGWTAGVRYALMHPKTVIEAIDKIQLKDDLRKFERGES